MKFQRSKKLIFPQDFLIIKKVDSIVTEPTSPISSIYLLFNFALDAFHEENVLDALLVSVPAFALFYGQTLF